MMADRAIILQSIIRMLGETETEGEAQFESLYLKTLIQNIAGRKEILSQDQHQIVSVSQVTADSDGHFIPGKGFPRTIRSN